MAAYVGTELEFIVFTDSYERAWQSGYRDMTPANLYNVDYSIIGTSRVEPLLRDIRLAMDRAGLVVESAKGECNFGQHEIAFRYREALATCDDHVVYKTAAKEIAAQRDMSLTFMAKYDEREGNSCHIHLSFRGLDGSMVMASDDDAEHGLSGLGGRSSPGRRSTCGSCTLLFAPNINSYKRFAPGSFAPTAVKWGRDNRTCALRLVGRGSSLRLENRVPGGDVNPYLAVAGMVAGGLDGIERGLEPSRRSPATRTRPTPPGSPGRWTGRSSLGGLAVGRDTFGPEVQDHYTNLARIEIARVRPRRHGLGALPRLRATVTPGTRPSSVRTDATT